MPDDNLEPCIVVISQPEIDQMSNVGYLRTLLSGLEDMRPETIVIIGGFISEANSDKNEGSNPAIYE